MHGGAGRVPAEPAHAQREAEGLRAALAAGGDLLAAGGSALDAVVAAVRELERRDVFNAGRGGALDRDGAVALDALVMEGGSRRAGGVVGVARIAHPIDAALAVLRDGRHVLLAGEGAERFARERGLAMVDPDYHITAERRAQLARALGERAGSAGGTVGAVARDAAGHLAAATSTGGLVARLPGRVSDSALPGSGTWADDATCAVSATGLGDFFIRAGFARDVDARMRYASRDLADACAAALAEVAALGGNGGCTALAARGDAVFHFDTDDMPRGVRLGAGAPRVAIYGRDELA
ncbi:MAG TPA: isoaspartyl peptidase/L-asparaginase [Myxococcota bacterium]|nr:isoaspartyl peptidase/L-asparaginase [Myxococcota bacterium]